MLNHAIKVAGNYFFVINFIITSNNNLLVKSWVSVHCSHRNGKVTKSRKPDSRLMEAGERENLGP